MSRRYLKYLLMTIAVCGTPLSGAKAQTTEDEGWWTAVFTQGELSFEQDESSRWRWWFDGHARFQDDSDGFDVSIVRPGIGYKLTDNTTAWAGYGWIHTDPIGGGASFDESRIWQQLTWSRQCGDFRIGLRPRFEQRFLTTGEDTGMRFRQFASARAPISADERVTLVLWDEVFIHLNDTDFGTRSGFNQNRAFFGFGWKPCPEQTKSRVEIGYLNQFINGSAGRDRMNHLLAVNFFLQ